MIMVLLDITLKGMVRREISLGADWSSLGDPFLGIDFFRGDASYPETRNRQDSRYVGIRKKKSRNH